MTRDSGADGGDAARVLVSVRDTVAGLPELRVGTWAVKRVGYPRSLERQIRELGKARYSPAVPILAELWEHCRVDPIRVATGHALFGIGTSEARAVLRTGLNHDDRFVRFMALKTAFSDEGTPWDNVGWLFSADRLGSEPGIAVAGEALGFLSPSEVPGGLSWWVDEAKDLLSRDSRWLDLCIFLCDHPELGWRARDALRNADPAVTGPALRAAAAARRGQARPRSPRLVAGSLIDRYQQGEHRQVWQELGAVDPLDDGWRAEAERLAMITMERVRGNAVRLVTALIERGWPVTFEEAFPGPARDIEEHLEQLERLSGAPVPPALAAFWRAVGKIDLVPREGAELPAGLPYSLLMLDPLQVNDLTEIWYTVEEWQEEAAGADPELAGPIVLELSADYLHKANFSGGGPYSAWVPCTSADPLVRCEVHQLSFTDYLRRAFATKGFPGIEPERSAAAGKRIAQVTRQEDALAWLPGLEFDLAEF
jgi:hypothetical protein